MQKLSKKAISVATVASLLITSSAAAVSVKAASVTPPESPRLWGQDRYETAVKVSQAGWTSTSDYAIIASGEGFADALCAAPLAKVNNAPILLTSKDTISQSTLDELKRLNVKHVYIIGGEAVVSQVVVDKIKSTVTEDIQRIGGQTRYETSVKVAEKLGVKTKVVLASGEGFADALSAAPVAAIEGMPILLTESKILSKPAGDYIKANSGITKTYVIGGIASVSESTMGSVPGAERFGGSDRFETNAKVIEGFSADFDFKNVYVALGHGPNGNEFADALTGSALAAKNKNPLIITGAELSSYTKDLLKSKLTASSTITVLGGSANVSDTLLSEMKAALPAKTSSGGGGSSSGGTVEVTKPDIVQEIKPEVPVTIDLSQSTKEIVKVQLNFGNISIVLDLPKTLGNVSITAKAIAVLGAENTDDFSGIDLDIRDSAGNKLTTPVPITLSMPKNVTAENAAALHYVDTNSDGTADFWLNLPIKEIKDGKVTFETTFSPVAIGKVDKVSDAFKIHELTGTPKNNVQLTWNFVSGNYTYNVYRNDKLIASKLTDLEYFDKEFVTGDNKYHIVACNENGIPVKKTAEFTVKVDKSILGYWIEDALNAAKDQEIISNNFSFEDKNGKLTVSLTDDSLRNKSISGIFTENIVNKIKNGSYSEDKKIIIMKYVDEIKVSGTTLKEYLISKLEGKDHTQTAIDFIKSPSKTTFEALKSKLNNDADTYDEVVTVIKDTFSFVGDKEIPRITIAGSTLNKILINEDSELIAGNRYSIDTVKEMLGVSGAIGGITLSDLSKNKIGFKFSNGETIWISIN